MNSDNHIREMISIFDQVHSMGKKLHIWKRQRIPNLQTFDNLSYNSWASFRKYLNDACKIDESASFQWIQNKRDVNGRLLECIHLKSGHTIYFTGYDSKVELIFDHKSTPEVGEELCAKLNEFKEPRGQDEIGLLTKMHGTLDVNFFKFRQYEHDIIPYLGDDIQSFYQNMVQQIQSEHKSGLYLLYGEPGTGKTSFIKRVLSEVKKQAIFVTPSMAEYLASPDLIGLLSDYSGSVLIIEDAEKILMKREGDNSNTVSTILNLSDGFTADFLNLNIICTFNTEITEIDPALLRKGRLKGVQEFSKLSPEIANKMAKKLGIQTKTETSITLAELCNVDQPKYSKSRNGIGFKVEE